MDTKEAKPVDKRGIQKNAVRLALVIFFVATVSAAGGFLQGERTALTNRDSQTARVILADAGGNDETPTSASSPVPKRNPTPLNKSTEEFGCDSEGGGLACTNKCSTSYVLISADGKDKQTLDCAPKEAGESSTGRYPGNEKLFDEGIKILAACKGVSLKQELEAQCLGEKPASLLDRSPTKTTLDRGGLISDQQISAVLLAAADGNKTCSNGKTLSVFEKEIEDEIARRFAAANRSSATTADANRCNYKGAAVCYKTGASAAEQRTLVDADDVNASSEKWECVPKKETTAETPPSSGRACSEMRGVQKQFCNLQQKFDDLKRGLGNALNPENTPKSMPRSSGGGGSSDGNNQNQCPPGYTQSTERGRSICTKDGEDKVQPRCLLVASKEKIKNGENVTLRWRTANAEIVKISGINDAIARNGEKKVRPTETTTYTLTATSKDKEAETCTTTVKVEEGGGDSESTGSAPPKISCSPNLISKEKKGIVTWACTAAASSSKGEGLDTKDKLAGKIAVGPDYNTEYTVTCLDKNKKEIGENSCSINVGESKYDILVYPTTAKRGDRVRVSWASLFMKSCRVQGPRGFDYTRTQGVVITEPFALDTERVPNRNSRAAVYNIECKSQFGGQISKDVMVQLVE